MSVMLAISTTTTSALGSVQSAASMVTSLFESGAAAAQVLEVNAKAYRDDAVFAIAQERKTNRIAAVQQAKVNVANKLLSIEKQLADPKLKAIYDQVSAQWDAE